MSRAAFLPSPGDPFVLLHCVRYFLEYWQDAIDKLYICINSDIYPPVVYELINLLKHPKIMISYVPYTLGHGKAIDLMLSQSSEDHIMLIEDDSIIFDRQVVDDFFFLLENKSYDLVGSPRMSCTKELADELAKEFDLNYEGWGDKGPNFWPCFLWTSRELLLKTDRNFGTSKYGDTFVNTSIQLRRLTKKILEIPQYHCSPDDKQNEERGLGMFSGECGYMHFGSLSSGIENTLLDENSVPLKEYMRNNAPISVRKNLDTEQEKIELMKRVGWWARSYELNEGSFGMFGKAYAQAILDVIKYYDLSLDDINSEMFRYKRVIQGEND